MPNLRNLRPSRKFVIAGAAAAGMAVAAVSQTNIASADDVTPATNTQLAVRSTGNALFVLPPGASVYRSLGGVISGSPVAVQTAAGANTQIYIANGQNGQLYVRRATGIAPTTEWTRLVPSQSTVCTQPDAKLYATTLIVGCKSSSGQLRYGTATIVPGAAGANPVVNSLTSLGGVLDSGPAVYSTGAAGAVPTTAQLHFLVTAGGVTYDRSADAADNWANTGIHGTSQPTVLFNGGTRYTLIRGTGGSLHYIAGAKVGDGGIINGRPAATVNSLGEVQVYVVGQDNHIYTAVITTSGLGSFNRIGGGVVTNSGISSSQTS